MKRIRRSIVCPVSVPIPGDDRLSCRHDPRHPELAGSPRKGAVLWIELPRSFVEGGVLQCCSIPCICRGIVFDFFCGFVNVGVYQMYLT